MPNSFQQKGAGDPKHLLGIDWAPLNIPWERRMQTFAVINYVFIFLIAPPLTILLPLYVLLYTKWWWTIALYALWVWYDWDTPKRGSRPIKAFQNWSLWKHFANYFPITIIKTVDLDPTRNYILGYHPHGIMGLGDFGNFATNATDFTEKFPGITAHACTLVGQFWFPFRREYVMSLGAIEVSKTSIRYVLTKAPGKGHAAIIVIGGAMEALEAHPGEYRLHLRARRGFVKLALQTGADLVPCFTFGENESFEQVSNPDGSMLRKFQVAFKRLAGFSPPVFKGRGVFNYTFGILPFRRPITTIVGTPIHIDQALADPSQEQIDDIHQKYCAGLDAIFEMHKGSFGIADDVHLIMR